MVLQFITMAPNPSYSGAMSTAEFVGLLSRSFIQLIGEEAVTILPLLAVLWLCVTKLGLSRGVGLVIAVLVSTVWFAAMHLPTYDWNIVQCLGVIGTARLVLDGRLPRDAQPRRLDRRPHPQRLDRVLHQLCRQPRAGRGAGS